MPSIERDPDELADWATSGTVWLTGRPDGPPLVPPGRAATFARQSLAALGLSIPGVLGERAAYAGLGRAAPWSCGGAFRVLPTTNGWLGLSLPRRSDLELVPALVESRMVPDPWEAVAAWDAVRAWAAGMTGAAAEERLRLLGLAGGIVPETPPRDRPGIITSVLGSHRLTETPLVIDLTSLWAGPLCAHLLGLNGVRVIKVESVDRPDGARFGPPEFFNLLHAGHEQISFDFRTDADGLRELISGADLVLEASRPRALRQLGIVAEDVIADGTSWLSITARGRDSDAVGFGDDVAASAGLVVRQDGGLPEPAGDALADPVAGIAAAVAARRALSSEHACLIDVSMQHVVAETLDDPDPVMPPLAAVPGRAGSWWLDTGGGAVRVEPPRRRELR